jgi:hypothetical protein
MSEIRKSLQFGLIAVLSFGLSGLCLTAARPEDDLRFEESSAPVRWPGGDDPIGGARPAYAATLAIRSSPSIAPPSEALVYDFCTRLAAAGEIDFSPAQLAFQHAVVPGLFIHTRQAAPTPGARPRDANDYSVVLYAVSPDDAAKAAQAYLYFIGVQHGATIRNLQASVARTSQRLGVEPNSPVPSPRPPVPSRGSRTDPQAVPYDAVDQAYAAIVDLIQVINSSEIEIVGIQAGINAIQGYQNDPQTNEFVRSRLDVMLVEQSVALRSAEARKDAAVNLRKQARQYIQTHPPSDSLSGTVGRTPASTAADRAQLDSLRRELAAAWQEKFTVLDNRITIHPVAFE